MAVSKRIAILNAAEMLFATRGLRGASLRMIAASADVDLSLVTYHFKTKDQLFGAVIERRTQVFNREQELGLEACAADAAPRQPALEDIVSAYCGVFLRRAFSSSRHWRHFFHLYTRFSNDPGRGSEIMSRHFDPIARRMIQAMTQALPHAHADAIQWGFQFLTGALGECLVDTGSVRRLSENRTDPEDLDGIHERLVSFASAGIRSLCESA